MSGLDPSQDLEAWWWFCGDKCECVKAMIRGDNFTWEGDLHSTPDTQEWKEMSEEFSQEITRLVALGHQVDISDWDAEIVEEYLNITTNT